MRKKCTTACFLVLLCSFVVHAEKPGVQNLIQVSTPSGAYAKDQTLAFTYPSGDQLEYAFLLGQSEVYVPYVSPIALSALKGEEREYRIKARLKSNGSLTAERELSYVIDKKPPLPPQLVHQPGIYSSGIYPSPLHISFQPTDESILYSVNEPISRKAKLWDGTSVVLETKAEREEFEVFAYTLDRAGNTSVTKRWVFTLEAKKPIKPLLEIRSPVPGVFANKQYLYIASEGYSWVKYSISGEDPVSHGELYTVPLLIERTGNITLKVAAQPVSGGSPVQRQVTFTVQEDLSLPVKSGQYTDSFRIELPGQRGYYTMSEKTPNESDPPFGGALSVEKIPSGVKYLPFRFKPHGKSDAEYRYYFVIDNRHPSEPVIETPDEGVVSSSIQFSMSGPSYARIYYTTDGSTPDRFSTPYTGPVVIDLPEKSTSGSILIKAVSVAPNGVVSPVASRLIYYDREAPPAPVVTATRSGTQIMLSFTTERDTEVVYELTLDGTDPAIPTRDSARMQNPVALSVPFGMEALFKFRCAALDRAGNLSAPTEVLSLKLDRLPPEAPELFLTNNTLFIEGDGEILFSITDDGTTPQVPNETSPRYTAPIPLPGRAAESVTYTVRAISRDASGNSSGIAVFTHTVDLRVPELPVISGAEQGGLYNAPVTLHVEKPIQDTRVLYTLGSDGTVPPDPNRDSQILDQDLVLEGREGEEVTYTVKLLPMIPSSSIQAAVSILSFTVDRKKPDLPVLSGFTPDGIYNTPVRLTATVPDGVKFFIAYSTDSSESTALPDPFSSAAYLFQSSFTLDVADGEEKSFTIRTGAYDPAGNTAILEKPVKITIDKKSPDPPRFSGIPDRGLTNEAVLVSFTQTDGDVYYTLCKGSEAHEIPTKSSIRYEKPFLIEGEAGREIFYNIQAISFDRAGNISPECSSAQFIIDREPPPKPEKPSITPLKLKNSLIVSWPAVLPALQDVSIYYAAGSEKEYRKYDLPFEIKPDKKESISLSYYAEDDAGNRSEVESIEFDLVSLSENFVSGIQQGMVTNKPVRFTPLADTGIVRYEVSTSGREPAPVSQFSSLLGEGVQFDAAFGETINFSVRFKLFESVTDPVGGSEKSVSFTIDKTPPEPPELSGITDGAFYQDDRILSFTAPEGDIFYLITYTDTGEPLFEKDFSRYTAPVRVGSHEGEFNRYTVSAYTLDRAGNKSTVKRQWKIAIDKKIIYVDPSRGNDSYDGTRTKPFKTIGEALKHSSRTGRKTIYLAGGEHRLDASLDLSSGIVLSGGYDGTSWERSSGKTVLVSNGSVSSETPLILSSSGGGIEGITLKGGVKQPALRVSGGEFIMEGSSIIAESGALGLIIDGGTFRAKDSEFKAEGKAQYPLIRITNGEGSFERTSVSHGGGGGKVILVSVEDGEAIFSGSSLDPGSGEETIAIESQKGTVHLSDTTVQTGEGMSSATGVSLKESILFAQSSRIAGGRKARVSTCIFADSSTVDAEYSSFDIAGDRGAVGIMAVGGVSDILSCTFTAKATAEFLYLCRFSGSVVRMVNNHMTGSPSLDYTGLTFRNGSLLFVHNTLVNGEGKKRSTGIEIEGGEPIRILNNIITQKSSDTGVALSVKDMKEPMELAGNLIGGARFFLKAGDSAYTTIGELNGSDGNLIGGNIYQNATEPITQTFPSGKTAQLLSGSKAVNGGIPLSGIGGVDTDFAKRKRPNQEKGSVSLPDIGADELYQ